MLNLRMCVFIWRLGRWVSSDYNDFVFCKEETSTAIGMIKEKNKDWRAKLKKSQKIKKVLENPTRPSTCEDVLRAFSYQIWVDWACERAFSYKIWLDRACESEALDSSGRVARPGQIETSIRRVPGPVTGIWLVSFRMVHSSITDHIDRDGAKCCNSNLTYPMLMKLSG